MAALTTVRLRGAEPLPHELVQVDQAPQTLVLQRGIEPMPHEAEPVDQAPQALVLQWGTEPVPREAVQVDQAPLACAPHGFLGVLRGRGVVGVPPRDQSWRLGSAQAAHLACACQESVGGSA